MALQKAISGRRAHREQLIAALLAQMHVPVLLQHRKERRQKRDQAFDPDAVDRFSGQQEGLLRLVAVGGLAGTLDRVRGRGRLIEQGNRLFASIASHGDYGIEQDAFLGQRSLLRARSPPLDHHWARVSVQGRGKARSHRSSSSLQWGKTEKTRRWPVCARPMTTCLKRHLPRRCKGNRPMLGSGERA